MLRVTDFDPKGVISGVRVQAGLSLDMLEADRSPNPVSVHPGTSQVDFEADCPPPPCLSTRRSFDHHGEGTVSLYEKEFRKMKKSRISH